MFLFTLFSLSPKLAISLILMAALSPCSLPSRTQNLNPCFTLDLGLGFSKRFDSAHLRSPKWTNFQFKKLGVYNAATTNHNALSFSDSTPSLTRSKSLSHSIFSFSLIFSFFFSGFS